MSCAGVLCVVFIRGSVSGADAGQASSLLFQADLRSLQHLTDELQAALKDSTTSHFRKVTRNVHA